MSQAAESAPTTLSAMMDVNALEAATRLAPDDSFPDTLMDLPVEQLQILHSRLCRQLELEYLDAPDGGHPITVDRLHEVRIEFDARFLR